MTTEIDLLQKQAGEEKERKYHKSLRYIATSVRLTSDQVDQKIPKVIENLRQQFQEQIQIQLSDTTYHIIIPGEKEEILFSGQEDTEHFTIHTKKQVVYIMKRKDIPWKGNNSVSEIEISTFLTTCLIEEINIILTP